MSVNPKVDNLFEKLGSAPLASLAATGNNSFADLLYTYFHKSNDIIFDLSKQSVGIAKYEKGKVVGYTVYKNENNKTELTTFNVTPLSITAPAWAIYTEISKVERGDIVVHDGTSYFVENINNNNLVLISSQGTKKEVLIPNQSDVSITGIKVVKNLFTKNIFNQEGVDPILLTMLFGNNAIRENIGMLIAYTFISQKQIDINNLTQLLPMLCMLEGKITEKQMPMILLSLMLGGGSQLNNILPFLFLGK